MKTLVKFIPFALLSVAFGCQKGEQLTPASSGQGEEIVIGVASSTGADIETKALALNEVPGTLYWGATTGSGTESLKYSVGSFSVTGGSKISTGRYQTLPPTPYNHYLSNVMFTIPSTGAASITVSNNGTDVLVGRIASTTSAEPSVELQHIFARTGSLSALEPAGGYVIDNVSYQIVGKGSVTGTAGVYNMTLGSWSTASSKLSSPVALTGSSDMYLIPGEYTINISFRLKKGDWQQTFTQSGDVTLVAGKINNITCQTSISSGDEPVPMNITVSVAPWSDNDITTNVS